MGGPDWDGAAVTSVYGISTDKSNNSETKTENSDN
jgi:hypothetical protein